MHPRSDHAASPALGFYLNSVSQSVQEYTISNIDIFHYFAASYNLKTQRRPNCMLPLMYPAWTLSLLLSKVMFCVPVVY